MTKSISTIKNSKKNESKNYHWGGKELLYIIDENNINISNNTSISTNLPDNRFFTLR